MQYNIQYATQYNLKQFSAQQVFTIKHYTATAPPLSLSTLSLH